MRKRKSEESGFNIWRSYSDMMAGVLLLFVLIMCVTLFQAQKNYNDMLSEKDEKAALQEEYSSELEEKRLQIEEQTARLDEQEAKLQEQQQQLDSQRATLADQETKLADQETKLADQEKTLRQQRQSIEDQTRQLQEQQQKIDNIIGVKAEVIEALTSEFEENDLNVQIDEDTGAMMLETSVMFERANSELRPAGKFVLDQVLPIYCTVLLDDKYKESLAEISIDGYTDDEGDYAYNLKLSQERSLAVAEYLLEIAPSFLNEQKMADLEQYLAVNGHSESKLIYNADGSVNREASRRVEVKFRLKDEEMMQELNSILSGQ